jgi:hypothetical protein
VDTFAKLLLEQEGFMGTARRQYPDEFKREALELLVSSGRPLSQIAGELGIPPERLRAWRNINQFIDWSTYSLTSLFVSDSLTT